MLVVYDSLTGNVQRFVNKLDSPSLKVANGLVVDEPFVLITYTIKFGQPPDSTMEFLEDNHEWLRGICASGNRAFGYHFCRAADVIAEKYGVSILLKFELSGSKRDVQVMKEVIQGFSASEEE